MVKLFSLKSPDEWATTKQACRDTYVVTCFLPSTIRKYNNKLTNNLEQVTDK